MRKDWRDKLKVGDVIMSRAGTKRIIRKVTLKKNGFIWGVTMVIRHCSWTTRPVTAYCRSDLASAGFRPTGQRKRLKKSGLDALIEREAECHDYPTITCCDVSGVP